MNKKRATELVDKLEVFIAVVTTNVMYGDLNKTEEEAAAFLKVKNNLIESITDEPDSSV